MNKSNKCRKKGFVAMIATMIMSIGILGYATVTLLSAVTYADQVFRREVRTQVRLNLTACLDAGSILISRDYFITGTTSISSFGCVLGFRNDGIGHVSIDAAAQLSGITEYGKLIVSSI